MMREIRNQEGEDTIGSLIYEMNQKVGLLVSSWWDDLISCEGLSDRNLDYVIHATSSYGRLLRLSMSWNSHRHTSPCQGDPEEDVNAHQDGVDCGQGHTKSQAKGHLPTAPVQKGERIRWHADQWTMHWHRVKGKSFRCARICPSDTVTLLSWFWRSLQDYYEPMDPGTQLATQDTQEWSYRPLQDDQHQPIHFHE